MKDKDIELINEKYKNELKDKDIELKNKDIELKDKNIEILKCKLMLLEKKEKRK
jgi:hypothetical protein